VKVFKFISQLTDALAFQRVGSMVFQGLDRFSGFGSIGFSGIRISICYEKEKKKLTDIGFWFLPPSVNLRWL
jgi:hypothetical protein